MKEPVLLGVYGTSNKGKTRLIVNLIHWLTKKDFKVATIKNSNKNISLDTNGKDTDLHKKAGASLTVFTSKIETTFLNPRPLTHNEIIGKIQLFDKYDIILIEGAHDKNIPKVRIDKASEIRENTLFTYTNIEEIKTYIKEKLKEKEKYYV